MIENYELDLIKELAKLYLDVEQARALWERAGGEISEVPDIKQPRDLWQQLWRKSKNGATVTPEQLLKTVSDDYPRKRDILNSIYLKINPKFRELMKFSEFDLNQCLGKLDEIFERKTAGLIGIGLAKEFGPGNKIFFNSFHERLKQSSELHPCYVLEESDPFISISIPIEIDVRMGSTVDSAIEGIYKFYEKKDKQDGRSVIIRVEHSVLEEHCVELWEKLCSKDYIKSLNYRLIIVLPLEKYNGTKNDCLVLLGKPVCEFNDAKVWLNKVLTFFEDKEIAKLWKDVIRYKCSIEQENNSISVIKMWNHIQVMTKEIDHNECNKEKLKSFLESLLN